MCCFAFECAAVNKLRAWQQDAVDPYPLIINSLAIKYHYEQFAKRQVPPSISFVADAYPPRANAGWSEPERMLVFNPPRLCCNYIVFAPMGRNHLYVSV